MPRSSPSPADQELVAYAHAHGHNVSARQIERWRQAGLLPPNIRRYPGRGRGSTSAPAAGAADLVIWLAEHARPGRRPSDLALLAFAQNLEVPEATIRAAFREAASVPLRIEGDPASETAAQDVADAAVASGIRGTILPTRIRSIDRALTDLCVDWSPADLATYDPGPTYEPFTSDEWSYTAVHSMLTGGGETDLGTLAALARAVLPKGAFAPVPAMMEQRWPGNEAEAEILLNEEEGLTFLPEGDIRDHFRTLADDTPLSVLLEAWSAATRLYTWATDLCDVVEREIDNRQPGEATEEWIVTMLGSSRALLSTALRDPRPSASERASTAILLIFVRNMINKIMELLPDGQFDLLTHPTVLPTALTKFIADPTGV